MFVVSCDPFFLGGGAVCDEEDFGLRGVYEVEDFFLVFDFWGAGVGSCYLEVWMAFCEFFCYAFRYSFLCA